MSWGTNVITDQQVVYYYYLLSTLNYLEENKIIVTFCTCQTICEYIIWPIAYPVTLYKILCSESLKFLWHTNQKRLPTYTMYVTKKILDYKI